MATIIFSTLKQFVSQVYDLLIQAEFLLQEAFYYRDSYRDFVWVSTINIYFCKPPD